MKRLILSVVLAGGLMAAVADEVTRARYPDADAVLVDDVEKVRYQPDGTYESIEESWTKILTEKGRREESVVTLDYSKRYGEAAIRYVGIVDASGVEREVDVRATTKESTDNGSMASNIYDPLDRKIVCTVPGLKIGETLHLKRWRRTTKARCAGKWADLSVLEWSTPMVRATYEITAPAELPLKRISIRHPLGNVVTNVTRQADGSTVYLFTATNSPQAFPEPDMPPLYTQVQHVRVSTAADWREISRWYWELCAPHLAKTNAAMAAKVRELTAESNNQTIKQSNNSLRAIFKFVSQEIRYMGLTMEDTSPGYAPHDVDITFDNRYGVCRDKAGLLVAMLRLAGFEAYPVLIQVGAKHDPEVPQPFFNHAIVAVADGKDYVLMDPTNENAKDLFPAYLNDKSYLVCRPDGETLKTSPIPSPLHNAVDIESKGTLAKDGSLFLESEVRMNGINDTEYRRLFVRRKPEDRIKFFERVVKAVQPGADLIRCEIEPKDMRDTDAPIVIRLAAKLPEMVLRGETRDELTVPFLSQKLGLVNYILSGNTALAQRKYPLELFSTARTSEKVTVDLGGALGKALDLPPEEKAGSDGYRFALRFAEKDGTLTAERSLTIGQITFSPAAYQDLREAIKDVEAAGRKRPVFARDPLEEADIRMILSASETTIASDREWVTTNEVVKEVLTYDGKKRSAELKFAYNPTWKEVRLLEATVSNRNGTVARVTDRECNVMDCGWAASAPRYPAGKLLVVNLPSVEIGSVISYRTVTTVTNAPAAFYATYVFDAHEPLERRVVRVNDWRREVVRPRRLPNEPNQPADYLWRDQVTVSSNRFERFSLAIPDLEESPLPEGATVKEIRDWMSKYVKVVGPGLYELPLALQLTDPAVILKERYATRLDYIRTLCALLRFAGHDADVVLAAGNGGASETARRRQKTDFPNVRAFATALCRVRERTGGFLGFGGEERTLFLGTENQYAPLGPSAYDGSDYFDPETGTFGVVTVPDVAFVDFLREKSEYDIREDGAVDLVIENEIYGSDVGTFRKTYSEILPEDRFRRHQSILGEISQAATATGDLETDVEGYPARRKLPCYIPDFATVQGDAITLRLSPLVSSLPALVGAVRRTPFALRREPIQSVLFRQCRWRAVSLRQLPRQRRLELPVRRQHVRAA